MLNLWNKWELRVLILLSLSLQLCLSYFGRRRRYSVKPHIHIFLWFCYLVADSVAIIALGVISSKQGNSSSRRYYDNDSGVENGLMAFWAPFMLLHLGGQDTITAYAVQDNDLWLRHLLALVVQSGVAIYIVRISWKGNWLSILTILMLLAGFIKYAERIWAMQSANRIPTVDGYKFRSDHALKEKNTGITDGEKTISIKNGTRSKYDRNDNFPKFRPLFLNRKIHHSTVEALAFTLRMGTFERAFEILEIELGHAYDTFYTKIPLFCTASGCLFRCISFSSIVFVLVFFLIKERPNYKDQQIDLIITYILLVGAVVIEIYAVMLLVTSDVGPQWLKKLKKNPLRENCSATLCKQTWSKRIGQFNMLNFCLKNNKLKILPPELFPHFQEWFFNYVLPKLSLKLEMVFYRTITTYPPISDNLKQLVWEIFRQKTSLQTPGFSEYYNRYISGDEYLEVEIYQSIIIWHIATDLCFHTDNDDKKDFPAEVDVEGQPLKNINAWKNVSKEISDYMMYILTMCPFLLSSRNAEVSFAKACEQVQEALNNRPESSPQDACRSVMSYPFSKNKGNFSRGDGDPSDSLLLYDAFQVTKKLRETGQQWEILVRYWVEHLGFVATLCQGKNHAKQLLRGGEFLTHVWFLIEHLDLKKNFRKPPSSQEEEQWTWAPYFSSEL